MTAGDNPFMVDSGRVTWDIDATPGSTTPSASAAWNSFGYRVGELRDLGPVNTWNHHRAWSSGVEARALDLMMQDYGGPLAEFKLTDLRIPGFWWGQEPSVPAASGGGAFVHTLQPSVNPTQATKAIQIRDNDRAAVSYARTYLAAAMPEIELVGNEAGEVTYTPTYMAKDVSTATAAKTVTEPVVASYKHFHGSITAFGVQLLRVTSWRLRCLRDANRARYWSTANPRKSYEFNMEDANYILSVRCVADGVQFPDFTSRNLSDMADNGDLGQAILKWTKTTLVDEAQVNIGSANDALGLISAPRIRSAGGGRVMYELDLAARTSTYKWTDASNARYFPA